jgi:hypothetical protein
MGKRGPAAGWTPDLDRRVSGIYRMRLACERALQRIAKRDGIGMGAIYQRAHRQGWARKHGQGQPTQAR